MVKVTRSRSKFSESEGPPTSSLRSLTPPKGESVLLLLIANR